ncbi:bifunctional folylpolyglutamate synthase/dihydrofolate synthase [Schaalia sp. 19OD2882]|uniref:bifunctional folylpolyglutamate synthase/dihydrofolate synthase n=1 Tax=Schaalia sp. 19OD2882 TaxID=2794089 RepID=UPI001C1EA180|nr:folylpolyglutamate synthase/dihydrofolate synthase family protein [Schaalia sp. 19OD2882]QWW18838.1 bifunctional folylpolyglutamate synthase/dihydrofolate synthase [Schaalia sp. 19OD2882]
MSGGHPAFFGDDHTNDDDRPGVPSDLLPYLEAADLPDDEDGAEGGVDAEEAAEDERLAALRALVAHDMVTDPELLAELQGALPEGEEWVEDIEADRAEREQALAGAADEAALAVEVDRIYRDILTRAPEHRIQPSLQRVRAVLDILGDPQDAFPSIHVTGTNGKTSTTRMIDALMGACGLRTGRFTSPHLSDVRERIGVEGEPISRAGFVAAWHDVAPYIDMVDASSVEGGGPRLSFFEVFTVMALAAFADHPVDAAVIEVGMGGLWDATNVIDAGVSVIMPVAKDHEKWLGASLREIATEKAGIIKAGQIVVVAAQEDEVLEVIEERAREVDAVVRLEGRDWQVLERQVGVGGQLVTVRTPSAVYEDVFVPLLGAHQAHNAAAALVAVESFLGGRTLDPTLVEQGMVSATSPGRLQVVRSSPTIVVDAAHNPAGARALADAVEESFDFRHVVGIYSAMGDKDVEGVLAEMEPHIEHLVLVEMPGERAMDLEDLHRIAEDVFGPDRVQGAGDLVEAVDTAVTCAEAATDPADRAGVLVFGSVLLAGALLDMVQARRR